MNKTSKLLLGLALADLVAAIDSTAVNVALPNIASYFNISANFASWMETVYILALVIILIPAGKIGDLKGHKKLFVTGLTIFGLASLAIVSMQNYNGILVLRIIQGAGAAMLYTSSGALVAHNWKKTEAAFGVTAAFFSLGLLLGPIVGGLLSDLRIGNWQGWHLIFAINIPIIISCFLLVKNNCEETKTDNERANFDYIGLAFLTVFLSSLILLLTQSYQPGLIILGAISFITFVYRETHCSNPLVNLKIFTNRTFAAVSIFTLLCMFIFIGLSFVSTFYIQGILHKSATVTGLYLLPMFLGMSVSAYVSGLFRNWKIGAILASVFIGIAMVIFIFSKPEDAYFTSLFWGYLAIGVGGGLMMTNTFAAALGSVKKEWSGLAAGYINTVQQIGSLAGIAFVAGLNILVDYHQAYMYLLVVGVLAFVSALFIENGKG